MRAQTYEITFLGQAGTTLQAEFDDCQVTVGPGTTTVRAELPDRGALSGLIERINSLGLDVIDVNLVAPPVQQLPAQVTHRRVTMRAPADRNTWRQLAAEMWGRGDRTGAVRAAGRRAERLGYHPGEGEIDICRPSSAPLFAVTLPSRRRGARGPSHA